MDRAYYKYDIFLPMANIFVTCIYSHFNVKVATGWYASFLENNKKLFCLVYKCSFLLAYKQCTQFLSMYDGWVQGVQL